MHYSICQHLCHSQTVLTDHLWRSFKGPAASQRDWGVATSLHDGQQSCRPAGFAITRRVNCWGKRYEAGQHAGCEKAILDAKKMAPSIGWGPPVALNFIPSLRLDNSACKRQRNFSGIIQVDSQKFLTAMTARWKSIRRTTCLAIPHPAIAVPSRPW